MPGLNVKIGASSEDFNRELARAVNTARDWAKQVQKNVAAPYASQMTGGDVKNALAATGGAMEKVHVSGRGLQHLFHMLGVEGSGAISLLVHSLASPLFLAISAAAGAVWLFNKALQALSPVADTLGILSLAPKMEKFREKTIEARAAVLEWAHGLRIGKSAADALNDSLRTLTNTTEAWAAADDKVAEARKGLELAKIKQLAASGQISPDEARTRSNAVEAKFDQGKLESANKSRNVITHATVEAAEKAEAGAAAARGRVPGLNDAYLDAQGKADANAERINTAQENLKTLAAKREKLGAGGFAAMGGNAAVKLNQEILGSATEAQPGLLAGAKGAKGGLEKAEQDAIKLRKEADEKRRDADMRMTKSAAEYKADKEVAAIKAQTRQVDHESEEGREKRHGTSVRDPLNADQKIGAYSANSADHKTTHLLEQIRDSVKHLHPPAHSPMHNKPTEFGGFHQ